MSTLNILPMRVPIGRATDPTSGKTIDVLMTPEFWRALSDIFTRVGGSSGLGTEDIALLSSFSEVKQATTEHFSEIAHAAPPDQAAMMAKIFMLIRDIETSQAMAQTPLQPAMASVYKYMGARDAALLFALMRNGGVRLVTLGDSIKAGIGSTDTSPYGECAGMLNQADTNLFAYSLIYADPNFVAPRNDVFPVQPAFTANAGFFSLGSVPLPNWQITKGKNDTIRFVVSQDESIAVNTATIYYMERNNSAAATFRLRVFDGATLLGTATVDTWVANPTFTGVGAVTVQGRIAKFTLALSAAARALTFVIDNPDTVSRNGAAAAADGTAMIFGATVGNGVFFRNLAVSSSTLLDASADNVSRGITTTERLAKAAALNANAYFIGWGTNDSKTNVSSISAYKVQLMALISKIRATVVNPVIVLATAPRGLAPPYEKNYLFNAAMREVAVSSGTSLIDFEDIAAASPAYSDDVHPTRLGYDQMAAAWCASFCVPNYRLKIDDLAVDLATFPKLIVQTIAGGTSNFTGTASTIATQTANRPGNFNLRLRLHLIFAATVAFNQSVVRIKAQGYAGLNGTGATVGGSVVFSSAVFSAPLVTTVAVQPYSIELTRIFSAQETRSIVLTVEGINWGLRNADATHFLELEFIPAD